MNVEVREKVDRYADLLAQQEGIKLEIDDLKAYFEGLAETDLENTKLKTCEYYGNHGSKVVVQNSATVKPISWVVLEDLFGSTKRDFIKQETKYILNDVAKTLLANMFKGDYIEDSIENVVSRITVDPKLQKTLMKRLKGKYKQDVKNIMKYAELDENEASEYAYMIEEVMAYQMILRIIEASGFTGSVEDAVAKVKSALIVDESIKVSLEAEN